MNSCYVFIIYMDTDIFRFPISVPISFNLFTTPWFNFDKRPTLFDFYSTCHMHQAQWLLDKHRENQVKLHVTVIFIDIFFYVWLGEVIGSGVGDDTIVLIALWNFGSAHAGTDCVIFRRLGAGSLLRRRACYLIHLRLTLQDKRIIQVLTRSEAHWQICELQV